MREDLFLLHKDKRVRNVGNMPFVLWKFPSLQLLDDAV